MSAALPPNRRILLVDDNLAIYDDFRRILMPRDSAGALDSAALALFGAESDPVRVESEVFELDYAQQGEEACDRAGLALASGRPYALAFVDMRMPPGWDGLTTIRRMWEIDPNIQAVICTAYSDRSWSEIQAALTARDRWLVLKKPFDKVEVLQLAQALTEKWNLTRLTRLHLSTLEEEVQVRTEQLRHAVQVKNEFLANVTHELLTPMNGILGMLQLVNEGSLTPDQASCINDALSSAERLEQLLRQIVAYNQAEAGTLSLESAPFSPTELLTELAAAYRERAREKNLGLEIEPAGDLPPLVHAPVRALRQILLALVDNAVKFTAHGRVALAARREGSKLVFTVADTGMGLTQEQQAWIALPFAQVDGGLRRRNPGIGMGLPLAKRLASSLGGELTLSSTPGAGTTVTLVLDTGSPALGSR